MAKLVVHKSPPLRGSIRISGSKNAVLPILAASLLAEGKSIIGDVPNLKDVVIMQHLLQHLGVTIKWSKAKSEIELITDHITEYEAPYDLVSQMRASFLIMGPLLARIGKAKIPLPGGCAIGSRPVDLHLKGFSALGAEITQQNGYVEAYADKLKGSKIYLDFPSVGATENIMMAAVYAEGTTIIENAAVEPEIVDLANYLNKMGADIRGAGTDSIKINGVEKLTGTTHCVIPDRIEAGTFMIAGAITRGEVFLENVVSDHLKPIIAKLKECNIDVSETEKGIKVCGRNNIKAVDIKTLPYPGFPTDMQAPFMSLLSVAEGTSMVIETVFENRFMHVGELKRMGAQIKIESRSAIIDGVKKLTGTQVKATDLRAGAALILCALVADETTEISDIYHIERGYSEMEKKLAALGARIEKIK
ncbi:UDP-N-acetylglucosamine 1-carboxyvinyltransferase [Defluviitalea raffinosedens]|uniref:UDP-N-acetylglucosamine 1-carboxyvinyltransferase n=1 Tax=Defluviitalea raffinosedens TaxID=1450156 RepID=A0A7C8LFM1_9FIRM|nr:UDP-N-acetylglucosamine 1-carboxyvinyltransferase [Defluviitalea raffinosedens]KAE9635620.1 UDP-N-acetylglucosamine 1-carboxyvinyltransferase [Defluviitalea raffinosedens]MBM7684539.1 UDP-N-acetylglucosamine 1-carboxyvinyltransferase [Defluviitalea raffinosedens]